MRGTVFDIRRGVSRDGPGLRTSVFLKGCPLRCVWCHNPESQSPGIERAIATGEVCGREMSVDEVMAEVRRDKVFYDLDEGADSRPGRQDGGHHSGSGGVTITGGEPMMQADFAFALAAAAHGEGIHVAVDTCGFAPWAAFGKMLPVADLFLYDLKCMDAARHRRLTGADNGVILENLRRLDGAGAKIWIRAPLAPGLNDSDEDLAALRAFVSSLRGIEKFEICPYHPLGLEKYAKFGKKVLYDNREQPPAADLARWRAALTALTLR